MKKDLKRSQDIVGLQISDLILTCNFSENYAKNLYQFIQETFEYEDFTVEINGIVTTIILHSHSDIVMTFKKKSIKNKIEVNISSMMLEKQISTHYHNYFSFCEMLTRLKNEIQLIK